MTAKGFLKFEQKEKLQILVRSNDSPRLREHALILLLQNDGKTYEDIANFIGCGYRTVAHWYVHGDPDNLDSLKDKRQQGNYRKATEQYIELLLEVIEKAPSEFGYEFGRWTGERLSTYLEQQTGIKLSSKQISRILQKKLRLYLGKVQLRIKAKQGRKSNISREVRELFKSWSCSTRDIPGMVLGRNGVQLKSNTKEKLDTSRQEAKSDRYS